MEIKYSAVCAIVLFIFKHFNCADGHPLVPTCLYKGLPVF